MIQIETANGELESYSDEMETAIETEFERQNLRYRKLCDKKGVVYKVIFN
jgi:hypothetical protein